MNRCPITYEKTSDSKYSKKGLLLLSRKLDELEDFPYTCKEQVNLAVSMSSKLSIQGVQPKLSVDLNVKFKRFEIVETHGNYIVKPPHYLFDQLPQNEDLTMKLAGLCGIETPCHGMFYNVDTTLSYFIRRFDRGEKNKTYPVEDFSQLLGLHRDIKYNSSVEKIIKIIEKFCSFPDLEKIKFFRIILFNFLIGNEDMHVKNFSLITKDKITKMTPSYDLINTSIVMKTIEELALL